MLVKAYFFKEITTFFYAAIYTVFLSILKRERKYFPLFHPRRPRLLGVPGRLEPFYDQKSFHTVRSRSHLKK